MIGRPQVSGDRPDGSHSRRRFLAVIGGSAVVGLGAGLSGAAEESVPAPWDVDVVRPPTGFGIALTWSGVDPCSSVVDHYRVSGGGVERTVPAGVDRIHFSPESGRSETYEIVAVTDDGRESSPATIEAVPGDKARIVRTHLDLDASLIEVGETAAADIVLDPGLEDHPIWLEGPITIDVQFSSPCAVSITDYTFDTDIAASVSTTPEEGYQQSRSHDVSFTATVELDEAIELTDPLRIGSVEFVGADAGGSALDVSVSLESESEAFSNWTPIEVEAASGPPPGISNLGLVEWGNTIDVYWDVDGAECPSFDSVEVRVDGDVVDRVQPGVNRITIREGGFITVRSIDADGQRSRPLTGYQEITSLIADPGTDVYAKTPGSAIAPGESVVVPLECRTLVGSPPDLHYSEEVVVEASLVDPCTASITDAAPMVFDEEEWMFDGYDQSDESFPPATVEIADDGSAVTITYPQPFLIQAFETDDPFVGAIELTGQAAGATNLYATLDRFHSEPPSYPWSTVRVAAPDSIDGPMPTDPDGDGLYEDLSGDGAVNFPDVNTLFQQMDSDAVQDDAQFYDFSGDGTVDLQDVLALFETI
ncbi:hypothetical protein [Halococcoides cellulosivorans]|uniref:EF-hand domain-containing protein n=1 Tax=Halococcoides cellulosivorans TaxID=1679096 RepID=A0A2R4X0X4_9EURY|nr:hypothetical protein [Halococcoides cellulosivorans]AWB27448.1 hypothetical protein HARCEL1_06880 [Halococcoides cellulosivorans]